MECPPDRRPATEPLSAAEPRPSGLQIPGEPHPGSTGFDYLRLGLAFAVLGVHVVMIADPAAWAAMWQAWFAPIKLAILPAFFALSGYLVTGSLARNTIPRFLVLRAIRIFPALAVEVVLSALVFGLVFTDLPLLTYLSSPEFLDYLLNIVGLVSFTLPGVFEGREVNTQLWTIPFEFECYGAIVLLAAVGIISRRGLFVALLVAVAAAVTTAALEGSWYEPNWNVPGRMLIASFLWGAALFQVRSVVPRSLALCGLCGIVAYAALGVPNLAFLAAAPIAYGTMQIGISRLPPIRFGDWSYGIYLFHFPIARAIHEATGRTMSWEGLLALTLVATTVAAALSWHLVEAPILRRKARILAVLSPDRPPASEAMAGSAASAGR